MSHLHHAESLLGVLLPVIPQRNDRHIGLGLGLASRNDRQLNPDPGSANERWQQELAQDLNRARMLRNVRSHRHELSLDKLEPFVTEEPERDEMVVLLTADPARRLGRQKPRVQHERSLAFSSFSAQRDEEPGLGLVLTGPNEARVARPALVLDDLPRSGGSGRYDDSFEARLTP